MFKRTGQSKSVTKSVTVGFEYTTATSTSLGGGPTPEGLTRSISTSGAARRKSRRMGTARCTAKLGGICTRSVRSVAEPSLRMSSSAYSNRSKDFMTAGKRCCPALVSTRACGFRSNSWVPTSFSSAITWRDRALCEINSALAAAVKLECLATPSKARNAFNGSQRRSIVVFAIRASLGRPRPGVRNRPFLIGDNGLGREEKMIGRPKSGGSQNQHGHPQRRCVDRMTGRKPDAQHAHQFRRDDQVEDVGDQKGHRNEHRAHVARGKIVEQPEARSNVEVDGRDKNPKHDFCDEERVCPVGNE